MKPETLAAMSELFRAMRRPAPVFIRPQGEHKAPEFSAELRGAMEHAGKTYVSLAADRSLSPTPMLVMLGNVYPLSSVRRSEGLCDGYAQFLSAPLALLAERAVAPGDRWTQEKRLASDFVTWILKLDYTYQGQERTGAAVLERITFSGHSRHEIPAQVAATVERQRSMMQAMGRSEPAVDLDRLEGELWFDAQRGRLVGLSATCEQATSTRGSQILSQAGSSTTRNLESLVIREGASPEDACELLPSDSPKPPTPDELRVQYRKQYDEHFRAGRYAEAESAAAELFALDGDVLQLREAVNNPMLTLGYTPSIREGLAPVEKVIRAGEALVLAGDAQTRQKRFTEAESSYNRALAGFRNVRGWWIPQVAECLVHLGRLYDRQEDFEQAEKSYQRALAIRRALIKPTMGVGLRFRVEDGHLVVSRVLPGSAAAASLALPPGQRVFQIAPDGGQRLECADIESNAAAATAEELLRGPQGTKVKVVVFHTDPDRHGPQDVLLTREEPGKPGEPLGKASELVESLMDAAEFYTNRGRAAEAGPLINEAAPWLAGMTEVGGVRNPRLAAQVALLLRARNRLDEAERLYEQTLAQRPPDQDPDPAQTARLLSDWAELCTLRGKSDDAVALCRRALALREAKLGADHDETVLNLEHLAAMLSSRGQWQEASPLLDRAWKGLQAMPGQHDRKARCLQLRAEMSWHGGHRDQAVIQLRESLAEAEKQRGLTSGAEVGRAALFGQFASGFERMAQWQLALGQPAEAHDAMERARARTLLDQLTWHGVDLLTGSGQGDFSWEELGRIASPPSGNQGSQRFRSVQRYLAASATLGRLHDLQEDERRFQGLYALSPAERRRQREDLMTQIAGVQAELAGNDASDPYPRTRRRQLLQSDLAILDLPASVRRELFFLYRDESVRLRNEAFRLWRAADRNDPAYWQRIAQEWSPAPLSSIQDWMKSRQALLLQYLVGAEGTYVLSVDPEGRVALAALHLADAEAKALGCPSGPLTGPALRRLLSEERRGVVRLLADADQAPQAVTALAELWKVLVPAAARACIEEGKARLLVVVPDGPLSLLPFEALVAEPGEDPTYLLDVGPPVLYCQSATLLATLSRRAWAEPVPGVAPVLSVADPLRPAPDATPGE
ncbi:MAG: tetratricopeptide repeat protein, partial [Pirellulales bacterium]|nr:tetratricopeptide repeat protein [Pirellulales bacterium]